MAITVFSRWHAEAISGDKRAEWAQSEEIDGEIGVVYGWYDNK